MKRSISEILAAANALGSVELRANHLRANDSTTLRAILTGAFAPEVKWLLPEGDPPYRPNELHDQEHMLFTETRKLYLFVEGGNPNLKQLRREALFIELLERLAPQDAVLMLHVIRKKLPYPMITEEVVRAAFPGLL